MPRVKCPKCGKDETVLKSGFVRGTQRFFCKECNYHFTLVRKKNIHDTAVRKKRQTTIIDIAKAAGVSVSTVSRALKDHSDIRIETRETVKQIARAMDYHPNLLAQSLYSRETHTIGVIVPDIENPFFASVLSGIQHMASVSGYKVMICQSNESHKTEVDNIQAMMNNWVDGLLICHSRETQSFEHLKLQISKGIPIVHFDRICEEVDTPRVVLDNGGAVQIVEHLLDQGCGRIGVIAGPKHLYITRERVGAYLKTLGNRRTQIDESLICYTDFSRREICKAIDSLMKRKPCPDALFCISDNSAIISMIYLKRQGVRIPDDLCVAGFGNDYTGIIIEPSLTTYDPYPFKVGQAAVELFFEQLMGSETPKTVTIKGKLIIRNSSVRNPGV